MGSKSLSLSESSSVYMLVCLAGDALLEGDLDSGKDFAGVESLAFCGLMKSLNTKSYETESKSILSSSLYSFYKS